MDIFGTKKLASKVESLSQQIVANSEQKLLEVKEIENKYTREIDQLKAARQQLINTFNNFGTQIFAKYNQKASKGAYKKISNFYSVVSTIANEAAAIPFYPEMKNGTNVKENDKIFDILNKLTLPKKIACYTYFLTQGEIFVYKEKIDLGVNAGITRLVPLNPLNVTVFISEGFPVDIIGYRYWDNLHGTMIDIAPEDMMYVLNFNPDEDTNVQVRGLAPADVLLQPITREESGMDISIAQMQNGGVPGVLYDESPGLEPGVLGQRRDAYGRYLRNTDNKSAPYFAAGKMGYLAIGSKLVDMDLSNLMSDNLDMICNVFHVSSTEFNNKAASTESNVGTHSRSFYTRGVLPIVRLMRDGLNSQVLQDVNTKAVLREDVSDIPELQPNMKEVAEGLAALPIMRPNDVLEKAGWKRDPDPLMDKFYIKSGYTAVDELSIPVEDIQNTANDYNNTINTAAKLLSIKTGTNG